MPAQARKLSAQDAIQNVAWQAGDARAGLRRMIDESVEGDTLGLDTRRDGETVRRAYPAVILIARKPA